MAIAELRFIDGLKEVIFSPPPSTNYNPPIPRKGEKVTAREVNYQVSGKVDRVEYYYSVGNSGNPCISIYLTKGTK